ncbi:FliA/WhiG family RNA polymerase sigma factor [Desulfohalovibrio reitneri]|uniref:FliA/WhiG family RNA polymerase sigma factor n=1 Tax=Desulfohalovibrio reitneri TaxID=1307759 RepID=UPI0004A71D51|nr:FliA/WhiG family RNA polymerase sigma factor [Desulfohalovibrio reitneri]
METSNSSGNESSSRNSPWRKLESGEFAFDELDRRDKEEVVRHYAPKIKIIGLRLKAKLPRSVELSELISAGGLGLVEALRKFDASLGIKFETYAENRIKGAMLDDLRRMDWFSRNLRQKLRQIEEAVHKLENETGGKPTAEQISEETGLTFKEVDTGLEMLQNQMCVSLDAVGENLASMKQDNQESDPFQMASFQEIVDKIAGLIDELTPREKLVLSLYYGEELNMRETAEVMEITEGRVSQLHSQALGKLRGMFHSQYGADLA